MTINISLPGAGPNLHPQITVIGVGGAGGNAVNNMIRSNLEGVDFLITNTDAQALEHSTCENKIQLGIKCTQGLGAGMRPDIGRQAAEETIEEIKRKLEDTHMIFIAAGMGGGTGTGAAPVIAQLARENGILTVGVVTKPFHFEGSQRMKLADTGIEDLQQHVDTLLTIPNQNLFRIANEQTTFADAFKMADDVLYAGVRGVTDLMVQPGLINLDFSDIKTVMSEMGKAMMGTGEAEGEGRAIAAAEAAIANPLIDDVSLRGAKGLIINITGGKDITLYEVDEAANRIKEEIEEDSNIIYGTTCDDRLEGVLRVSIVATGIDVDTAVNLKTDQKPSLLSINNSVYQKEPIAIDDKVVSTPLSQTMKVEDSIAESADLNNLSLDAESSDSNELSDIDIASVNDDITNDQNYSDSENMHENSGIIESSSKPDDLDHIDSDKKNNNIKPENIEPKTSVRRLSLFDTVNDGNTETNDFKDTQANSTKTEPVLEENDDLDDGIPQEFGSEEINPEEEFSEDDLNQETEEELLDIPTFFKETGELSLTDLLVIICNIQLIEGLCKCWYLENSLVSRSLYKMISNTKISSKQKTLASDVYFSGIGLHTGKYANVKITSDLPDSGITFIRSDLHQNNAIKALWTNISSTILSTTIANKSKASVSTIEHLMSALSGMHVDNARIYTDGPEIPIMDGSSKPFVELIEKAKVEEQTKKRKIIKVLKEVEVSKGDSFIRISPSDQFSIDFEIEFDSHLVNKQACQLQLVNGNYKKDISAARTFGFEKNVNELRAKGFALGGSLKNAVVVGQNNILNKEGLRFKDEFVRHKILDSIGDLYLAGHPVEGYFFGKKSGHFLNSEILKKLLFDKENYEIIK